MPAIDAIDAINWKRAWTPEWRRGIVRSTVTQRNSTAYENLNARIILEIVIRSRTARARNNS